MEGPGEPLGKEKGETCKALGQSELSVTFPWAALLYPAKELSQHNTKALVRQV